MAANIGGQAIIWGGRQRQPESYITFLPSNVVYSYSPTSESGVWQVMEATGSIHPGVWMNAFAVLNSKIVIFGGENERKSPTNAISTLSADGHFSRLNPKGWNPSSRYHHQGFAYNGKFYFIGGLVTQKNLTRKEDYILFSDIDSLYLTNELIEYDPFSNTFSQLFLNIQGARLSPRAFFALALLGDRVFIHGGIGNRRLHDFYVLDMKSLKLAEIPDTGYLNPIYHHVSISLSSLLILFAGGFSGTNQVKIFDAEKHAWKDEEPLSNWLGDGLQRHRAISFPRKDGASVLCLGGVIDWEWTHPAYMVLFNVTLN